MNDETDIILLIIALLLSAFFSGTETAYTASGRLALEVFVRHKRRGAKMAFKLFQQPSRLFSTTLVGNNLVGVLYSSVAALMLTRMGLPLGMVVVISPILVLIFGEILPKTLAREIPERWAMNVAYPLAFVYWLLYPLIILADGASKMLLFLLGERRNTIQNRISVNELRGIWIDLYKHGALDEDEITMLDQMVEMRTKKLRDIMTPRIDMVTISDETSVQELETLVRQRGYSRIPVFEETQDNIVGYIVAKDLLQQPSRISEIVRPVTTLPEQAPVSKAFELFQREKDNITIIVDEYGGTAGIVTLEDVLEEIVGDIEDEHDNRNHAVKNVAKGIFLVQAKTEIDWLREHWNIALPEGPYDTIGGLMIWRMATIPTMGDQVFVSGWSLQVVSADAKRLKRILVRKRN